MLLQRSNTYHKVARRWRLGSKKVLSWASVLPHQESDDLASNSKAHCFPRKHQSLGAWIFSECNWREKSLWGQISTSTWTSVVGKNITLKRRIKTSWFFLSASCYQTIDCLFTTWSFVFPVPAPARVTLKCHLHVAGNPMSAQKEIPKENLEIPSAWERNPNGKHRYILCSKGKSKRKFQVLCLQKQTWIFQYCNRRRGHLIKFLQKFVTSFGWSRVFNIFQPNPLPHPNPPCQHRLEVAVEEIWEIWIVGFLFSQGCSDGGWSLVHWGRHMNNFCINVSPT